MILRPVRPASPIGPPTTKRPVGLIKNLVLASSISAGITGARMCSRMSGSIWAWLGSSLCCRAMSPVSTGHQTQTRRRRSLAGHARQRIFRQNRVEHAVANLVAQLIRVPLRHTLAGEKGPRIVHETVAHIPPVPHLDFFA